jgi:hypothetical protein
MIVRTHETLDGVTRRAVFSDCERYRYELSITWDTALPRQIWLMMNPSTATEMQNDSTVELCERRALKARTYGGIDVLNVFAWRETDSRLLEKRIKEGIDIVGPANDETICRVAKAAAMVVCAWGQPGNLMGRGEAVRSMLQSQGVQLHVLHVNRDFSPKRSAFVQYGTRPNRAGTQTAEPCSSRTIGAS